VSWRNPQDTGFHIHGWFYGSPLSPLTLSEHALSAGLVNTHLQPVTYLGNFAYPLKAATWNATSLADFRLINGSHPSPPDPCILARRPHRRGVPVDGRRSN